MADWLIGVAGLAFWSCLMVYIGHGLGHWAGYHEGKHEARHVK